MKRTSVTKLIYHKNPFLKHIVIILILFQPITLFSQMIIKGKIVDTKGTPIEFAEVLLLTKDSIGLQRTLTDENGSISIEEKNGHYLLQIRQVGNILYGRQIVLEKNIDLGIIKVETSQVLEGVVIDGKKKNIEIKVDRLVFNVENSISSSGGDALDALRETPRIKVLNDKLEMIGKGSIAVMVDDRIIILSGEDLLHFLKTIKADDIKNIEVIANPPAKYSAGGNSGLININLKKTNNDSWNASLRNVYQQATYGTILTGGSFSYQKNNLTLVSNINYLNGSNAPLEKSTIHYPHILWYENNQRRDFSNTFNAKLNLDYKFSNQLTMGIQFNTFSSKPIIRDKINSIIINRTTQHEDSVITTIAENQLQRSSHSLNYHLEYALDSVRKVLIDFDYFSFHNQSNRKFVTNSFSYTKDYVENSFLSARNTGIQKVSNYSFNLDIDNSFGEVTLNYGGRLSFSETQNRFSFYDLTSGIPVFIPAESNEFIFKENTQALFVSAQKEITKKWKSQIGLRMESTQTEGISSTSDDTNTIKYIEFFPTTYVTYTPNYNHSFSLNYGKRINRPSFSMLNPFKWISSPFSYTEGNPYLLPSFNNNIEFNYTYQDFWTNAVYFSSVTNGFEHVSIIDVNSNIQQNKPLNFISGKMVGINEYVTVDLTAWMRINLYADVYYTFTESEIPVTLSYLEGLNGEFSISNDFILNKDKTALFNMSFSHTTAGVDNLDRNTAFSELNVSLKLFFFHKKLQFTATGNDILKTSKPEYTGFSNNLKTSFKNYYDQRFFRISIAYNFGKKLKLVEERNHKNQEEINRSQ